MTQHGEQTETGAELPEQAANARELAHHGRTTETTAPDALQAEQIAEFKLASGVAPPERIWLIYTASGETVWCAEPDPEGNGEPSVGYALARAGQSHADAGLLEAIAGPEAWLDSWAQHVGNCQGGYVCTCGLTRARSELSAAIAAVKGA
jgi:hypothetical protein